MSSQLNQKTPGRNDPCPCGSGKKYKKCCGAGQSSVTRTTQQHPLLASALSALEQGDPASARNICNRILGDNADDATALQILGISSFQLGLNPDAENALKQAFSVESENGWIANSLASVLQELNKLEEAYPIARKAVELEPANADAHNNLGMIYRKGGHLDKALEEFDKACNLDKSNPMMLVNLGEALLKLERLPEARVRFEKALKLNPSFVSAENNLGVVLQKLHEHENALKYLNHAHSLSPDDPEILNNIALVYKDKGDKENAIEYFKKALNVAPSYALAYVNLAEISLHSGELSHSREMCNRALALSPDLAQAHKQMAEILSDSGDFKAARAEYLKALNLDPIYLEAINGLAKLYLIQDDHHGAYECLSRVKDYFPDSFTINSRYISVLTYQKKFDEAVEVLGRLKKIHGDDPDYFKLEAFVYSELGEAEKARESYRQASNIAPNSAEIFLEWARFEEKNHNLDEALVLLDRAVESSTDSAPYAHILRSVVFRRRKEFDKAMAEMDQVEIDSESINELQKSALYERANVLDRSGRFDEAYHYYKLAAITRAKVKNLTYDEKAAEEQVNRDIKFYSKEMLAALPRARVDNEPKQPIPLFIVGFPRSGTTLTEQILVSHPNIAPGGELTLVTELKSSQLNVIGSSQDQYPSCLGKLIGRDDAQDIVQKWRQHYLDRCNEIGIVDSNRRFFTDKMPLNLIDLPFITMLFPDSPIIHVIRNFMDSAMSAVFSNFAHGIQWVDSFESAAHFHLQTMKLIDHIKENLEMNYLSVKYEDLVKDQEFWSRKIVDFVGEEWDDRCLDFHKTKRVAATASYEQVTRKIYTTSLARYKNYEKHLQKPLEILRPVMEKYGYLD